MSIRTRAQRNKDVRRPTAGDTAESVLAAVERIAPIISAHAPEAERQSHLSQVVTDAMREVGLYRMFTPTSLGGSEMDPLSVFRIIEVLSAIDSATGWNLMASLVILRFVAALPDDTAAMLFAASPDTIFASTTFPIGKAVSVKGGYQVTACGRFGSGSNQAGWIMMFATIEGSAADPPAAIGVFFSPDEVVNQNNWNSLGMRGTGSHDIDAIDVFAPSPRTFPLQPGLAPGRHFQGPLYRLPYIAHTAALVAPVALGIGRRAVEALLALAEVEGAATVGKPLKERARLHAHLGKAKAAVDSARALQIEVIRETWETVVAGNSVTLKQRADLQVAMANAAASSFRAAELAMRAAGTSAIFPRNSLERHFRDIATLRQHAVFSENRFETSGRLYLGLMPEDYPVAIL